ncbi:MAG: type VI secretion system-associated FHA domain protein TagH [Paracoccaceae bacterium]
MTLRLIMETAPHPQKRTEFRLADGQVTIGRGDDCDWQIDDPQMFISRRHCVIVGANGQYRVTDESRGGVFVDAAATPLGTGVTAALQPGMRLRLGDYVIRAELDGTALAPPPAAAKPGIFGDDFFTPRPEAPPPPRPAGLPDPFDAPRQPVAAAMAEPKPAAPAFFDDPFTMDHDSRAVAPADLPVADPSNSSVSDFDFGDFGLPADLSPPSVPVLAAEPAAPGTPPPDVFAMAAPPPPAPAPPPLVLPQSIPAADPDAAAALLRGLGIDPPPGFQGSAEEIEALGRRYRLMAEGLVQLLRMRAQEKGSARVAQTVIGAANVNPLKFLVGTDEAVAALIAPKGAGYLDPDAAIAAALHDLMDHHSRSWTGLQASLRRMVDRFDPALFESEIEDVGMLKALVAGSRPARLWQLYADRYREIAKSAEDRFLGEVGADFRDAYENETRKDK